MPTAQLRRDDHWISQRIAKTPPLVRQELEKRGFEFTSLEASRDSDLIFATAGRLIGLVPSLNIAVQRHVDTIFLLEAGEQYDITHSEPRWPEWIFISRPKQAGEVGALRAAENVVHEAMHLQLSLAEQDAPLVADIETKLRSPWKDDPRTIQGVLHGLYVFVCISAFFERLRDMMALGSHGSRHVEGRLADIAAEIASISVADLGSGLTPQGALLLRRLLPGQP